MKVLAIINIKDNLSIVNFFVTLLCYCYHLHSNCFQFQDTQCLRVKFISQFLVLCLLNDIDYFTVTMEKKEWEEKKKLLSRSLSSSFEQEVLSTFNWFFTDSCRAEKFIFKHSLEKNSGRIFNFVVRREINCRLCSHLGRFHEHKHARKHD